MTNWLTSFFGEKSQDNNPQPSNIPAISYKENNSIFSNSKENIVSEKGIEGQRDIARANAIETHEKVQIARYNVGMSVNYATAGVTIIAFLFACVMLKASPGKYFFEDTKDSHLAAGFDLLYAILGITFAFKTLQFAGDKISHGSLQHYHSPVVSSPKSKATIEVLDDKTTTALVKAVPR